MSATVLLRAQNRFWSKVDRSGRCWLWTASTNTEGYGKFSIGYQDWRAHRFSWTLRHGPIPSGRLVCHRCDTPSCVRPSHLFIGTQADNRRDAATKGRTARGSASPFSKLTEAQVKHARSLWMSGVSQSDIARRLGVTQANISYIVLGKGWSWLK